LIQIKPVPVPVSEDILFATQLIRETENGEKLARSKSDSGVQSVSSILPPAQFVSVRRGAPVRTYQQDIDE
jgi:hypothetical protein